jgi:hypothetical protein
VHEILLMLMDWGDRHVIQGPPPIVWEHACGAVVRPTAVCASRREPVGPETITRWQ